MIQPSDNDGLRVQEESASQPLDLKESLRIRDGLESPGPKFVQGLILQANSSNMGQFAGICLN